MNAKHMPVEIEARFSPTRYNATIMATVPATWIARITDPIESAPYGTAARDGWAYADGDTREDAIANLLEGLREIGIDAVQAVTAESCARLYPVPAFEAGEDCDCGHSDADHENEWGNPCTRCSCIHPEHAGE